MELMHPGIIPDLRSTPTVLIASDYGGEHKTARYECLSFVFTNLENIGPWEEARMRVREQCLRDGRRMSYKRLSDTRRRIALPAFLEAANVIPGLAVSVLVDRDIRTLFEDADEFSEKAPQFGLHAAWRRSTIEKLLRVSGVVSLFLAGLSASGQNVLWLTDEDEIAANPTRLREFVNLFGAVSSHFMPHPMRHLRIGTSACDNGTRNVEDLIAVCDLMAGALQDAIALLPIPTGEFWLPPPRVATEKAELVMNWFSDNRRNLRRAVFVIDTSPQTRKLRISALRFHGSNDDIPYGLSTVIRSGLA